MADPAGTDRSGGGPSWLTPQRIVALVLVVIAATFVLQNRGEAALNLLWFTLSAPLWLFSLSLLAIGIAIGMLLTRRRSKG